MESKEFKNEYSRACDLSERFNAFWKCIFKTDEDYFKRLSITELVNLKKAVSNINNIITLRVTNEFISFLQRNKLISVSEAKKLYDAVDCQHPNANGFDIKSQSPKIIAEVKCCIPVEKHCYGAAQVDSIISDIIHLAENKSKSGIDDSDIKDYYKFMVLLDGDRVADSIDKLIEKINRDHPEIRVEMYTPNARLHTSVVYIVSIELK